jgi:hypothetical protein
VGLVGDHREALALGGGRSCTAFRAKGKVWIVQTMIFLPLQRLGERALLLPLLAVMVATTPVVR